MRTATRKRNQIINYIGRHGGFPVLEESTGKPSILRPDDEEEGYRRVGWPAFFQSIEAGDLVLVYAGGDEGMDYQFMPRRLAAKAPGIARVPPLRHAWTVLRELPVVQH